MEKESEKLNKLFTMNTYNYNLKASEQLSQGKFDFMISNDYHYIMVGDSTISQLKKAQILPNKSYKSLTRNKPDGLILLGKNDVKVLVEYKKTGVFHNSTEAESIITDWYYSLANELNCNIICTTDSTHTYWFYAPLKKEVRYSDGAKLSFTLDISLLSDKTNRYKEDLHYILSELENIDREGVIKKPKEHNPQNLARNVWQKIWITTGKQPEQCLYNVVEIFVFKYLSDLLVLDDDYSFDKIYKKAEKNPTDALIYYADNVRKRIKDLFPKSDIDGTTIINGTIFVNEQGKANVSQAILFKDVLKEFHDYGEEYGSFLKIDKNFKTRLYENFLRRTAGISSMGQYFTPRNVVQSIITMAKVHNIPDNACVCDPFCGVGGFLLEFLNENPAIKEQFIPQNGQIKPQIELIGYDKGTDEKDDQRTIILAKANMLIYLSDIVSKYNKYTSVFSKDVFNKVFHLIKSNVGTFGIVKDKQKYDIILTNPPYVTSGVSIINNELKENGIKDEIYTVPCKGLEGLSIEWIIYSLKEGGTAFIIVPEGVMRRSEDKKLRDYILEKCILNAIISLPTRTFFATPQDTYILSITKKRSSLSYNNDYNVFTYLVSEIGETRDSNRFFKEENDLIPASCMYRQFMIMRDDFHFTDRRCKIKKIKELKSSKWTIIDNWNDEEKIELGIEVSENVMSEKDFFDILSDLKKDITEITEKAHLINLSDFKYKTIQLSDIGSFEKGNSKYTKKYCNENKGEYPVFSSNTKGSRCIGHINTYDNDIECITITTNGHYAGTPFYVEKQKFSMNGDCGCFIIKKELSELISYKYIEYALMNKRTEYGFNWKNKPTPKEILSLEINIPIDENGIFDIYKQKQIVKRYEYSYFMKKRMEIEIKRLDSVNIDILK